MNTSLQITIVVMCIIFLMLTLRMVVKGRLQIKYSLLWVVLAVLLLVLSLFPMLATFISELLGFQSPSNFVFMLGLFFLLLISMSLSIIVSWQATYIRSLVQSVALLEKKIELDKKPEDISNNVVPK